MKVYELIGKLLTMPMQAEVVLIDNGIEREANPTLDESETEPKVQF